MMMHSVISHLLLLLAFSLPSDGLLSSNISRKRFASRPLLHPSTSLAVVSQSSDNKNVSDKQSPKKFKAPPTHRSTAVFALMESSSRQGLFAVRKLENDPDYLNLADRRDRAFARLMLTTAERRQGQIDKVITKFVQKPKRAQNRPVDKLVEATLRIGAAQLLFLSDVPPYAVLKETVDVLRMHPKITVSKPLISFVNAVLRSIDREGHEALETTSIFDNVEPWLIKEWIDSYGEEKTKAIVEASMCQSPIFLSVNHAPESTVEERRAKVESVGAEFNTEEEVTVEILSHGSIRVPTRYSGPVSSYPLYVEGDWWVQDASATLPAIALSNGLLGKDDRKAQKLHVVDLCSAPGGKTAQLCSFGFGKVTAVDVSQRRTKPLKDNLKRLKMTDRCKVVVADGREWKPNDGDKVHGVLVDAPCSATGVGSRRPDVLRKPADLDELTSIQRELAAHTADELLEPGGIMVYATCSLLKQESEDQMKWLLSRTEGADMETIPFVPGEIPGFDEAIDENGWLRVIPGVLPGTLSSCDGFFVARLRRL